MGSRPSPPARLAAEGKVADNHAILTDAPECQTIMRAAYGTISARNRVRHRLTPFVRGMGEWHASAYFNRLKQKGYPFCMRKKITIVGAGNVGATLAQRVAERDYADVVLVDIVEGLPQGKALDILEAGPVLGYDSQVTGTNSYDDTADSAIVVITSGLARKPGMSRDDLVRANQNIVTSVVEQVAKASPDAILIPVTNPLDAMAQLAYKVSKFPKQRIVGMAGVLDTARFRTFIAQELNVSVRDVHAYVLGVMATRWCR